MKPALTVFLKEVTENLRDRRTVINTLLTGPLFAPLGLIVATSNEGRWSCALATPCAAHQERTPTSPAAAADLRAAST